MLNNFITTNLPILFIIIPFLNGLMILLFRKSYIVSNIINILFTSLLFCIIFFLLQYFDYNFMSTKEIHYVVGNYTRSIGIELLLNSNNMLLLIMVSTCYLMHSFTILLHKVSNNIIALISFFTVGLNGMLITNDIFNLYVFFEIASISTFVLYSYRGTLNALKFTFDYLILSGIIGLFLLFGILILYINTGNLNMTEIFLYLSMVTIENKSLITAFIMIVLSLMLKIGMYPLHGLISKLYLNVPLNIIAFSSGTLPQVIIFVIIKYILYVFGIAFFLKLKYFALILKFFGGFGLIVLSFSTLTYNNITKILTMISLSFISYCIFCLSFVNNEIIIKGLIITLFTHGIAKCGLFLILDIVKSNTKLDKITLTDFAFYLNKVKIYKYITIIYLITISGIPVTSSFLSKWILLNGIIHNNTNDYIDIYILLIGNILMIINAFKIINALISNYAQSNEMLLNYKYTNYNYKISNYYFIVITIVCIILIFNILLFVF